MNRRNPTGVTILALAALFTSASVLLAQARDSGRRGSDRKSQPVEPDDRSPLRVVSVRNPSRTGNVVPMLSGLFQ